MQIINKKVEDLIPYVNNPRDNEKAVDKVAESIENFGFKVPIIVDANNEIITGHTRLLASKKLGLDEVPCIVADDLSEKQIKAFRIADNKVAEFSEWDEDLLKIELDDLEGIFTGFDEIIYNNNQNSDQDILGEPEVKFTEILKEEHNYLVLYFDNEVDWLQAESLFDIKPVQAFSTRKDGVITKSMKRIGIGRVLEGKKAIAMLRGDNDED